MSDQRLIDELRNGHSAAWAEMVRLYLKLVYHVVRKTLSQTGRGAAPEDVEDITNDLFQSLIRDNYRVLGTITEPFDLKAWLAVSARRRAIDFVRRRRLGSISLDQAREEGGLRLRDQVADRPPEGSGTSRGEHQGAVAQALEGLSPKERLVVQLFYLDGKKYREIAQVTGMNPNSISPTLGRALEKLQKILMDRNILST